MTPPALEAGAALETVEDRLRETADWSREIDIDGAAAWNALNQYQAILIEAGMSVLDDANYRIGEFSGRAEFEARMAAHAMEEAQRLYDLATEKEGVPVTAETVDKLAYHDFQGALDWLRKSGKPLFDEAVYEELGTTRTDFFQEFSVAHLFAARQKLGLAALWEGEPDTGIALAESALAHNLAPLGLGEDSPFLAQYTELEPETLKAVHASHLLRKFRAQVKATEGWRRFKRDVPEYHDVVLAAAETLEKSEGLQTLPDLFHDLGFTAQSFADEAHRCAELKLARLIAALSTEPFSGERLDDTMQEVAKLRALFGDVRAPEGTPPEFAGEDYWCAGILNQFGFRSFTHMQETLKATAAQAIINRTLSDRNTTPAEMHDDLLEATAMLKDARFPVNDAAAYENIGVNRRLFAHALLETTFVAAERDWNIVNSNTLDTEARLRIVDKLIDAQKRARDNGVEDRLPFKGRDIDKLGKRLTLRRAEEIFTDYLVALDTPDSFEILYKAYELIDELEVELLSPKIHGPMGMNAAYAQYLDDRFGMMEMADVWQEALDENKTLSDRFDAVRDFEKRFRDLDDGQVKALTEYLGYDDPPRIAVLKEDIATNLYAEMMGLYDDYREDPIRAAEYLRTAGSCLLALHPRALSSDPHYKSVTGKNDRAAFVAELKRALRRARRITRPLVDTFAKAAGVSENLLEALKPENRGRRAFDLVKTSARALRGEGRSVLDAAILSPLGFSASGFVKFLDEQAIASAREYADAARSAKGTPVTVDTLEDHPYNQFRMAYNCIARHSRGTVLSDAHWQAMGFASRMDFMDQCRDALVDYVTQLEALVATPAGMKAGPYGLLRLMRDIREGNRALGLETMADIPDFSDLESTTAAGGAIETTQRTIHLMAHTACQQILREKAPISLKYKKMRFVYDFAHEMRTTRWDGRGRISDTNAAYDGLIRARVESVVRNYASKVRSPSHGVRLALALKDMADTFELRREEWFQDLFVDMKYAGFDAFCDYAALQRINQIIMRTKKAMSAPVKDGFDASKLHLGILRDMMRIENLSDGEGLISERRRDDIFDELGVNPEWHRLQMSVSAQHALPLMLREAEDPTLEDSERWAVVSDIAGIANRIGEGAFRNSDVDMKRMAKLRMKAGRRMAALNMFEDLLRLDNGALCDHTEKAGIMMGMTGRTTGDASYARALGLYPLEAKHYKGQEKLLPAYQVVKRMPLVPRNNPAALYGIVSELYEAMGYAECDPHKQGHLERLGVKKVPEFLFDLQEMTLTVLQAISSDIERQKGNVEGLQQSYNAMLRFLEITDIDRRTPDLLKERGLLDRKGVVEAVTRVFEEQPVRAAKPAAPAMA